MRQQNILVLYPTSPEDDNKTNDKRTASNLKNGHTHPTDSINDSKPIKETLIHKHRTNTVY